MELEQFTKEFMNSGSVPIFIAWIGWLKEQQAFHLAIFLYEMSVGSFSFSRELLIMIADCYLALNEFSKAWSIYMDILTSSLLTEGDASRLWIEAHVCITHIQNKYSSYPEHIIKQVLTNNNPLPLITFTITTCKRLDLFERTMNSFLHCCQDIHLITHWICIDDNSSKEDCEQMKRKYPFFKFIFKSLSQKGHANSMNLLRNSIQTPYVFHMEDDWQFFHQQSYMSDCLEVINQDDTIGQCLVNKNYAEIPTDIFFRGGFFHQTSNRLRYYIHEYDTNGIEFEKKYGVVANCSYWPHYSLRPSLLRTNVWSNLEPFNPEADHFEMEYSYRYMNAGYRSAFLEGISCVHIGRLTRDRFDPTKQNAYTLNKEQQFTKSIPKNNIFIVNLEDRDDRYTKMIKSVTEMKEPLEITRFSAIDGYKLLGDNLFLEQLFEHNDYNFRRGMIGCALSHIQLWIQLINDKDFDYYIILEDDIEFVPYFKMKLDYVIQTDFDILFLGHHAYTITNDMYDKHLLPEAERYTTQRSLQESKGGTGGYVITKKGAKGMLDFIQERSMTNGIDTMIQKACDDLQIYYTIPHLIYSPCCDVLDTSIDTDIQRNYDSLKMTLEDRLQKERDYFTRQNLLIHETFSGEPLNMSKVNIIHNDHQRLFPKEGVHYMIHDIVHIYIPPSIKLTPFRLLDKGRYTTKHII